MKAELSPERSLNRRGWKILVLSLLTLVGTLIIQIVGFVVVALVHVPEEGLSGIALYQAFAAGGVVLGMVLLSGTAWLRPSREDVSYMWRRGWPILAGDVALLLFMLGELIAEGATISPDWFFNLVLTAAVCIGIGIFEELMFRGIVLNGLLAVTGKSHRGTMAAVVVTSLFFGIAHIDIMTDFSDPLLAAQAVLKIVQTGLFSIVVCEIVLRTHRLGGASLFHGLSDFLLMFPSLVLVGENLSVNYVSSGQEGVESIVVYLVVIAFYLPFAIRALRGMRRDRLAYRGVFMEKRESKREASSLGSFEKGSRSAMY